jgi:hypothetical protein
MNRGQRLYQFIFPPSFELMPKDRRLLEQMYPKVDWSLVACYGQMPWFMHYTFAIGTALPSTYSKQKVHIYIRDIESMSVNQRLTILVHEAYHIQQYHELNSMGKKNRGLDWGYNRRFMRYYIGWYLEGLYIAVFKNKKKWSEATNLAYRQHPLEIPAYQQEAVFRQCINLYRGHSVDTFFKQVPQMVCQQTALPKAPSLFFHSLGTFLTFLITIAKPIIEIISWPIAFLLGGRSDKKEDVH